MQFPISVGVRQDRPDLLKSIDGILVRDAGQIRSILADYGVPAADDVP